MAKQDFIRFYEDYLPKNPDLKTKIDAIHNEQQFADAVLDAGPKAGFKFTQADVEEVMEAKQKKARAGQLTDIQLDAVSGGVRQPGDTIMCCW
jgi:hypothetical protein